MNIDYFSDEYDPESLTDEEISDAQNIAIYKLLLIKEELYNDYPKVLKFYSICIASVFFLPFILYAFHYRHKLKYNHIMHQKTLIPLVVACVVVIIQLFALMITTIQLAAGQNTTESFMFYIIPALFSTLLFLSLMFLSFTKNIFQNRAFKQILKNKQGAPMQLFAKKITGKVWRNKNA